MQRQLNQTLFDEMVEYSSKSNKLVYIFSCPYCKHTFDMSILYMKGSLHWYEEYCRKRNRKKELLYNNVSHHCILDQPLDVVNMEGNVPHISRDCNSSIRLWSDAVQFCQPPKTWGYCRDMLPIPEFE